MSRPGRNLQMPAPTGPPANIIGCARARRTNMTTKSACEPWCDEHNGSGGECLTLRCLYSHGEDPAWPSGNPAFAASAPQFMTLAGFPDQVNSIFVEVSYVPAEEDRPELVLRFRDISKDADSATLSMGTLGLRQLHTSIGEFLQELEQA
jgi:hypothetical protein